MDIALAGAVLLIKSVAAFLFVLITVVVYLYAERKLIGHMQVRPGPMRVGFHGMLQPIADLIKLMSKEDIVPAKADKMLFWMAPIIALAPSVMLYLTIPIGEGLVVNDLELGFFYIFGLLTVVPVAVLVAGWASFSKYSLIGGLRAAAQQISYEIPLLASILGVIMMAGSFSLTDIVRAQQGALVTIAGFTIIPRWFIFLQPFGFIIFFIAALADAQRIPFDIPEAESELVQGYATEYSSMKFGLFQLGEYSTTVITCALAALAFFGGWSGPVLPGVVWFLIKMWVFIFIIIWLRATLPRVRIDQLMDIGWKILLPLTLINIMVTGFLMLRQ